MPESMETKLVEEGRYQGKKWAYWLAVGLILFGGVLNLGYLWNNCPLSLVGDECHYWEWSRHLDYGYYSKGPGIAWLMALSVQVGKWCGMEEASMALIRTPAVLLSMISGFASLALARRIFKDHRAGLAITILSAAVPMFVVGALMMTIDAPMYCCWALATYCLWRFIEPGSKAGAGWIYLAAIWVGLGMLFKPILIAWVLSVGVAALLSPAIRKRLKTGHVVWGLVLVLLMQAPIVIWNANHEWVMFRHISGQGGLGAVVAAKEAGGAFQWLVRLGTYVGGQAGGMGGILFVLLVLAWFNTVRVSKKVMKGGNTENCLVVGKRYLLSLSLPLWLFYAALSLWTNVEVNWPAAGYFTGMILLAGIVAEEWATNKVLKYVVVGAVGWGLLIASLAQHTEWLYPMARQKIATGTASQAAKWNIRKWDPTYRIRARQEMADAIGIAKREMESQLSKQGKNESVEVGATRYDTASTLAFYLPGHPFVYCFGSRLGQRQSQYDVWEKQGLQLQVGRDLILVGGMEREYFQKVLKPAFEKIEPSEWPEDIDDPSLKAPLWYQGMKVQELQVWRCYGFKGFKGQEANAARRY